MTIICAVRDRDANCTWIASDRQYTRDERVVIAAPKWVVEGRVAIAVTGPSRCMDVISRHRIPLLENEPSVDLVVSRLPELLRSHGCYPNVTERYWPDYGLCGLYASPDGIWPIDHALAAVEIEEFGAEGSGDRYALGAGFALRGFLEPVTIARRMVEAACAYDIHCGGEPWIHCLR